MLKHFAALPSMGTTETSDILPGSQKSVQQPIILRYVSMFCFPLVGRSALQFAPVPAEGAIHFWFILPCVLGFLPAIMITCALSHLASTWCFFLFQTDPSLKRVSILSVLGKMIQLLLYNIFYIPFALTVLSFLGGAWGHFSGLLPFQQNDGHEHKNIFILCFLFSDSFPTTS